MDRILQAVADDYHATAKTAPRATRPVYGARAALYGLLAALTPEGATMAWDVLARLPLGFLAVQEDSTATLDSLPQATVQVSGAVTCLKIDGDMNRQVLEVCLPAIKKAKYLHLVINSPGGYGVVGLELFGALRGKSECIGTVRHVCASAAAFALQGCRTRQIERNAWIMVHSPRHYAGGPLAKLESAVAELKRCQWAAGEVFQRCHPPRGLDWFNGKDYWFAAKPALAVGLVDEIVEPATRGQPRPPLAASAASYDPDKDAEDVLIELLSRLRRQFKDEAAMKAVLEAFAKVNLQ